VTSHLDQAIEFRTAMGQPIKVTDLKTLSLQAGFIEEEFEEFVDEDYLSVNELKELADLVYVCYQFAAAAGYDLDEALDRVHASNMSKLVDGKPLKNEAGKVLKGPNYQPPVLDDLMPKA
jgi:NTP pyrophosphatase (non-canonical NTP hydrolase)